MSLEMATTAILCDGKAMHKVSEIYGSPLVGIDEVYRGLLWPCECGGKTECECGYSLFWCRGVYTEILDTTNYNLCPKCGKEMRRTSHGF